MLIEGKVFQNSYDETRLIYNVLFTCFRVGSVEILQSNVVPSDFKEEISHC